MQTPPEPRHPHLRRLQADLDRVTAEAERLRAERSVAQQTWTPEPGTWSIAQCFDHLFVTGHLYHPRLRDALARATRTPSAPPFRPSLLGRWFIRFLAPESKRKVKTFGVFEPEQAPQDAGALDRFIAQQDDLAALLREADGVDLNSARFASPLTRLVRFTLGEGLTVVVTHQRRHLQQALRLTQHPEFPAA